ncbi:MAG: hypothetical protein EOO07_23180 [Chitinophagaceae bacterium]|nr:MAG: hypothetical protein EOO07_23180 [Chitinophagaceae bacterium]
MNHHFSYPMSNHFGPDMETFNTCNGTENEFKNISDEILPKIKTLIGLCAAHGLYIKVLNRATVIRRCLINDLDFDVKSAFDATENHMDLAYYNFGLAFGIGIYESSAFGVLKYLDHKALYDKVGKIGESIGLTWAANHPFLSNLRYFELRPDWANGMTEKEMMNELYRRKNAKISLLA